jgi:hypothetical protein
MWFWCVCPYIQIEIHFVIQNTFDVFNSFDSDIKGRIFEYTSSKELSIISNDIPLNLPSGVFFSNMKLGILFTIT